MSVFSGEDHWFPNFANTNWVQTLDFAMRNFKDESFISQFLSPKVIRDLKLFSVLDDDQQAELFVSGIHNDGGYQHIRETLSKQYDLSNIDPNIQIYNVNHRQDRALTLRFIQANRKNLSSDASEVMKHLYRLWGFPVKLETVSVEGKVISTEIFPLPE